MAHQRSIRFREIKLLKDQSLGVGSYGSVCKARCDNLICAAKIIHPTLVCSSSSVSAERQHRLPLSRFESECDFLREIRHPNIILFLGLTTDPQTGLPVLLMELMDDSLTHFLETSTQPVPFHIQVTISLDVVTALFYLHSNDIIHRDLSSNNILIIGDGIRAKLTDFGMAKLGVNLSQASNTVCPGTNVYMPPEAVDDQAVYTPKGDVFSFGVNVVQILSRKFPDPEDRFKKVAFSHPQYPSQDVRVRVSETERRNSHIKEIDSEHPLLPIALDCLKDMEVDRPSTSKLCDRVGALKEMKKYSTSKEEISTIKLQNIISELRQNLPTDQVKLLPRKGLALPRSISSTNLDKTTCCRSIIQNDLVMEAPYGGTNYFSTVPAFTLTLPSLDKYSSEFQQTVFTQLIDKSTQQYLEDKKYLNWCASTTRFLPLYTMGDGNCLLHAASLSMWGFHDKDFTLRQAVHTALQNHKSTQLRKRWKYTRDLENRQMGIQLKEHQWQGEWQTMVDQASTNISQGKSLESLEDFHIFVLANVLRRPIVVYAAPKLQSQATLQQINFHGIHLPALWDPYSCKKDPLPLAYCGGHFVSLVAVEYPQQFNKGSFTLPLVDFHGQTLPVRFLLSMEDPTAMMMDYLRVVSVSGHNSPYITSTSVSCASLTVAPRPAYLETLLSGFIDACGNAFHGNQPRQPQTATPQQIYYNLFDQPPPSSQPNQPYYGNIPVPPTVSQGRIKCINQCGLYGDLDKGGLCSECLQKHLQTEQEQPLQVPPRRQLCATAGCSFKGYHDLYNLCPDCYEAKYQRKAPDHFPLV